MSPADRHDSAPGAVQSFFRGWTQAPKPPGFSGLPTQVTRLALPRSLQNATTDHLAAVAATQSGRCVAPEPGDATGTVRVRFVHHAPRATAVAITANGWWSTDPVDACDLTAISDTGWWAADVAVPTDWLVSYRFAEFAGQGTPPWHAAGFKGIETHPQVTVHADAHNPRHLRVGGPQNTDVTVAWAGHAEESPAHHLFMTPESWPQATAQPIDLDEAAPPGGVRVWT